MQDPKQPHSPNKKTTVKKEKVKKEETKKEEEPIHEKVNQFILFRY